MGAKVCRGGGNSAAEAALRTEGRKMKGIKETKTTEQEVH